MALGGHNTTAGANTNKDNEMKVQLIGSRTNFRVVFRVTPDLIENRNVNYKAQEPVHMPGNVQTYQNTSSRVFNISNIKIVSRTSEEAQFNLEQINILRGWTMPYFGQTFTQNDAQAANTEHLGSPPEVLFLSAYSGADKSKRGNIYRVPVVVSQLSIPYPSDVDYIPTTNNTPFPALMTIDVNLTETHAPKEYSNFNLSDYRRGNLEGF